jgi:hypothetical protein
MGMPKEASLSETMRHSHTSFLKWTRRGPRDRL